jgi:hypothetical protein
MSLERLTYKSQESLEQVSILQTQDLSKKNPILGKKLGERVARIIERRQRRQQFNEFPLKQNLNLTIGTE